MSIYKFRAECLSDVSNARKSFCNNQYELTLEIESPFPDVVVEIKTQMSFEQIYEALASVINGHVMVETLAIKKEYTGKRRKRDRRIN